MRIQHKDHNRPSLEVDHCFCKVQHLLYLSPGNFIVLEIAAASLFIRVTNSCQFWSSFCWNSSTLSTDLFMFMSYARAAGLLSPRTYTLTLIQPGDIPPVVCSAHTTTKMFCSFSDNSAVYKHCGTHLIIKWDGLHSIRPQTLTVKSKRQYYTQLNGGQVKALQKD